MLEIKVMVIGDEALVLDLNKARRVITEELYYASLDAQGWLEASAKMFVPKVTGTLAKAIGGDVKVSRGKMEVEITVGQIAPYGPWVEYGTGVFGTYHRPYPTYAIGHWPSQRPPHPPVITHYLHPGMAARPYIRPAYEANAAGIRERYKRAGHQISVRLGEDK